MGGGMQRDPYFDDDRNSYCYRRHVSDEEWRAIMALRSELVALADGGNEHAQAFCDAQHWDTAKKLELEALKQARAAEAEVAKQEKRLKEAKAKLAAARQRKAKTQKKTRKGTGHGTRDGE